MPIFNGTINREGYSVEYFQSQDGQAGETNENGEAMRVARYSRPDKYDAAQQDSAAVVVDAPPDLTDEKIYEVFDGIQAKGQGDPRFMESGATGSIAHVSKDGILTIANAGDSPVSIHVRDPKTGQILLSQQMSVNHTPGLPEERARIEAAGGLVVNDPRGTARIAGAGLMVSRAAIGDNDARGLTHKPDIQRYDLNGYFKDGYEVIITTESDGAIERGNDEGRKLAMKGTGPSGEPVNIAKARVDHSVQSGASDNASSIAIVLKRPPAESVMAVVFDGHGANGGAASSMALDHVVETFDPKMEKVRAVRAGVNIGNESLVTKPVANANDPAAKASAPEPRKIEVPLNHLTPDEAAKLVRSLNQQRLDIEYETGKIRINNPPAGFNIPIDHLDPQKAGVIASAVSKQGLGISFDNEDGKMKSLVVKNPDASVTPEVKTAALDSPAPAAAVAAAAADQDIQAEIAQDQARHKEFMNAMEGVQSRATIDETRNQWRTSSEDGKPIADLDISNMELDDVKKLTSALEKQGIVAEETINTKIGTVLRIEGDGVAKLSEIHALPKVTRIPGSHAQYEAAVQAGDPIAGIIYPPGPDDVNKFIRGQNWDRYGDIDNRGNAVQEISVAGKSPTEIEAIQQVLAQEGIKTSATERSGYLRTTDGESFARLDEVNGTVDFAMRGRSLKAEALGLPAGRPIPSPDAAQKIINGEKWDRYRDADKGGIAVHEMSLEGKKPWEIQGIKGVLASQGIKADTTSREGYLRIEGTDAESFAKLDTIRGTASPDIPTKSPREIEAGAAPKVSERPPAPRALDASFTPGSPEDAAFGTRGLWQKAGDGGVELDVGNLPQDKIEQIRAGLKEQGIASEESYNAQRGSVLRVEPDAAGQLESYHKDAFRLRQNEQFARSRLIDESVDNIGWQGGKLADGTPISRIPIGDMPAEKSAALFAALQKEGYSPELHNSKELGKTIRVTGNEQVSRLESIAMRARYVEPIRPQADSPVPAVESKTPAPAADSVRPAPPIEAAVAASDPRTEFARQEASRLNTKTILENSKGFKSAVAEEGGKVTPITRIPIGDMPPEQATKLLKALSDEGYNPEIRESATLGKTIRIAGEANVGRIESIQSYSSIMAERRPPPAPGIDPPAKSGPADVAAAPGQPASAPEVAPVVSPLRTSGYFDGVDLPDPAEAPAVASSAPAAPAQPAVPPPAEVTPAAPAEAPGGKGSGSPNPEHAGVFQKPDLAPSNPDLPHNAAASSVEPGKAPANVAFEGTSRNFGSGFGIGMGAYGLYNKLGEGGSAENDLANPETRTLAQAGIAADGASIAVDAGELAVNNSGTLKSAFSTVSSTTDATADAAKAASNLAKTADTTADAAKTASNLANAAEGAQTLSRVAKFAGPAAMALQVGSGVIEGGIAYKDGDGERAATAVGSTAGGIVGGVAGAEGGAALGGAIGTFLIPIPGVGTAVGAAVGGIAGAYYGGSYGAEAGGAASKYALGDTFKGWIGDKNATATASTGSAASDVQGLATTNSSLDRDGVSKTFAAAATNTTAAKPDTPKPEQIAKVEVDSKKEIGMTMAPT